MNDKKNNTITNLFKMEKRKDSVLNKQSLNDKKLKQVETEVTDLKSVATKTEEVFTKAKNKRISLSKTDSSEAKKQVK